AEALAVLFELANKINKSKESDPDQASLYVRTLKHLGGILGLLEADADDYLKSSVGDQSSEDTEQIDALVNERIQAKNDKNWQRADEIRDELNALGIELEDNGMETIWRRV
ncbi:MAG: cysteine--tRNA ligase, partial [Gammaproteobacteria bacterium]|nr:cysteine--tRNA ligase [Gammaproteobacteria bacterium]